MLDKDVSHIPRVNLVAKHSKSPQNTIENYHDKTSSFIRNHFAKRIFELANRREKNLGKVLAGQIIVNSLPQDFLNSNPSPLEIGNKVIEILIDKIHYSSFENLFMHPDYFSNLNISQKRISKGLKNRLNIDISNYEKFKKTQLPSLKNTLKFTRDLAFLSEYIDLIGHERVKNWITNGYTLLGRNSLNDIVTLISGTYERMLTKESYNGYINYEKNHPNGNRPCIPTEYYNFLSKLIILELIPSIRDIINNDCKEIPGDGYMIFEFDVLEGYKPKITLSELGHNSNSEIFSFILMNQDLMAKDNNFFSKHKLSKYIKKRTNEGASINVIEIPLKYNPSSTQNGIGYFGPLSNFANVYYGVGTIILPGSLINNKYKDLLEVMKTVSAEYQKREKTLVSEYTKPNYKEKDEVIKLLEQYM